MSQFAIDDEVQVIAGKYKNEKAIVKQQLPVMVKIELSRRQGEIVNVQPKSLVKIRGHRVGRSNYVEEEGMVDLLIQQIKMMNLNAKERGKLIKALVEDLDK